MSSDQFLMLVGLLAYAYIIWSLHRGTPRPSTPSEIAKFHEKCQRIIKEMKEMKEIKERNHD